jgi:nucleoside-diphosphate-sugar epimerase
MKVFVAGATGAIGTRLVPLLVARGHEVIGTARSPEKAARLRAQGAEPVAVDLLDRSAVRDAVAAMRPDAIIHEATALTGVTDFKHFDRSLAQTNRLRTVGTDALLAAAGEAGVGRVLAQSFTSWPYARVGGPVKSEEDTLDPDPVASMRESLAAIRHLEQVVTQAGGIVLRYGTLYGSPDDTQVALVRKRRFPIVGDGAGVWSFVHLEDAVAATVLALEDGPPGIYNIVDDEPAPVREWLPALAAEIGAKPPRSVPRWLARLVAGDAGVVLMTDTRGASNAKAKRELGWEPTYPTWRHGFRAAVRAAPPHSEDRRSKSRRKEEVTAPT